MGLYFAYLNYAHLYRYDKSDLYKKYLDIAFGYAEKTKDNFEFEFMHFLHRRRRNKRSNLQEL